MTTENHGQPPITPNPASSPLAATQQEKRWTVEKKDGPPVTWVFRFGRFSRVIEPRECQGFALIADAHNATLSEPKPEEEVTLVRPKCECDRCRRSRGIPEAHKAGDAPPQTTFILIFNDLAREVFENAKAKGWWDVERNDGEMIALMHSELSEALEAIRNGNPPDDKVPAYLGTEAELADVIIRIMDMAHARKWRVAEAVIDKMAMNKGRPYKHGRKAF